MFDFRKYFLSVAILFFSTYSLALGYGIEAGFRQQSGDAPVGASTSSQVGYQFGAVGHFDLSEKLALRTGLLYTQRPLKITDDASKDSATVTMTYFDVPLVNDLGVYHAECGSGGK